MYVGSVIKNFNPLHISLLDAATSKKFGRVSSKLMPQWPEQPHMQALLKNGGAKFMHMLQRFRQMKLPSWLPILSGTFGKREGKGCFKVKK
jgi:hypothetical protein